MGKNNVYQWGFYGAAPNGGEPALAELRIFFSKQWNVDETNLATSILEHILIYILLH